VRRPVEAGLRRAAGGRFRNRARLRSHGREARKQPMVDPEHCRTMSDVRAGIDALDEEIVARLARRFRFMDAAARIKERRDQVRDESRKAEVLGHVRSRAVSAGAPPDLLADVYEYLIEISIAYELERFDAR
jgi:isochorismate pyruvate lyase